MTERDRKLRELKVQVQKRRMIANSLKSPSQISSSYHNTVIKNFHDSIAASGSSQMGMQINNSYILGGSPRRSPLVGMTSMTKKEEIKRRIS